MDRPFHEWWVHLLAITAVTGYQNLQVLKRTNLLSCSFRHQKSKMGCIRLNQGVSSAAFLLKAQGENPFPCFSSFWRLPTFFGLWPLPANNGITSPLPLLPLFFPYKNPCDDIRPSSLISSSQDPSSHLQSPFLSCNIVTGSEGHSRDVILPPQ